MNSLAATSSVRLSICIPTYNRARFLRECLSSIVSQFEGSISESVEIVISNNGSTDNTEEVIEEFKNKYLNITAIRQSENIGFDRNVLAVVSAAQGEFCWLLGDDDALFGGALSFIVSELTSGAEYYMVNCQGYNHELTAPAVSKPNLHISKNISYKTLSEFVRSIEGYQNIVGYFGGMSVQIFKRSIWEEFPSKEQWIGTQTIHLFVLLSAFKEYAFEQVARALVKTRSDNMRWDSFSGLETLKKRAVSTHKTRLWIMDLYHIPYSRMKLRLYFYFSLWQSASIGFIKKYLLSSPRVRAFVIPKIKKLLGK